jgi:hypothetical protein
MPRLAFTTTAIFLHRPGREEVQGFFDRSPATIASTARFDDFVPGSARIYIHPSTPPYPVEYSHPAFYKPDIHAGIGCTVSLWRSIEAVCAFAYSGLHAQALAHRKDWFAKGEWPIYAAWWASDDYVPTFADAAARLEHLQLHGSTSFAFDFKSPYAVSGEPTTIDRERVRQASETARQKQQAPRA